MSEDEKLSRWRYVPPVVAAILVAGGITYFNLTQWEHPFFDISWDYGWPQRHHFKSYAIYAGGNSPPFLTHDEIFYGALTANIALGVLLTTIAAWGVWYLNRINRSLFRIHLQTILLLVLAIGALMLLNTRVREFINSPYEIQSYGWPHEALAFWKKKDQQGAWPLCWLNVGKNAFVALYALFLITLISESWLAWRAKAKTKV